MPLEAAKSIQGKYFCTQGQIESNFIFTTQDAVKVVRDYILANPDVYDNTSKFIEGWGWDHTSWPVERWPTAVCEISLS
jgi:hypothetical protein